MSMEEPRALKDGWAYIEDGEFHLKKDAPEWAKEEIAEINMMGVNYQSDITPPTFNTINIGENKNTGTNFKSDLNIRSISLE